MAMRSFDIATVELTSNEDLLRELDLSRLPRHVAIIMDGNGRWAARRSMPRMVGHRAGADAVRRTIETAARLGRSEEHTSELQSRLHLVCRLLLEKKKTRRI